MNVGPTSCHDDQNDSKHSPNNRVPARCNSSHWPAHRDSHCTLCCDRLPVLTGDYGAVALAILGWPLHRWLNAHLPNKMLAASLSTTIVVGSIVAVGAFVTYQVTKEAADAAENVTDGDAESKIRQGSAGSSRSSVRPSPGSIGLASTCRQKRRNTAKSNLRTAPNLAQGSVTAFIQFLLTVFMLYYLFLDRDTFRQAIYGLMPLSKGESDFVMSSRR